MYAVANEKKTKEELTEIVFRVLRSNDIDINPQANFEKVLPKYEQEVKNILAEIILHNTDDRIVFQAMVYLITFFANISATKDILRLILQRIIVKSNQDATEIRKCTKMWVVRIADIQECKSIRYN